MAARRGWAVRLRLWAIGGVFVVNSLTYFIALRTVSASVVALLLYCYPVIVTLLAAAAGLERLTLRSVAVALLAFTGCAFAADADLGSILRSAPGAVRRCSGSSPASCSRSPRRSSTPATS